MKKITAKMLDTWDEEYSQARRTRTSGSRVVIEQRCDDRLLVRLIEYDGTDYEKPPILQFYEVEVELDGVTRKRRQFDCSVFAWRYYDFMYECWEG